MSATPGFDNSRLGWFESTVVYKACIFTSPASVSLHSTVLISLHFTVVKQSPQLPDQRYVVTKPEWKGIYLFGELQYDFFVISVRFFLIENRGLKKNSWLLPASPGRVQERGFSLFMVPKSGTPFSPETGLPEFHGLFKRALKAFLFVQSFGH